MTITVFKSDDGSTITILVPTEFDFRVHKQFRDAYKNPDLNAQYIVDFGRTELIDSSALGMLLLMREELGNDKAKLKFVNCRPNVRHILQIASFDQLFSIL